MSQAQAGGGRRAPSGWVEQEFVEVFESARNGDGQAFEWLYRWLAPSITTFATARGAEDPEGITNEAFLRAFRGLDGFAGGSRAFRSWLFTIARNLIVDAHRAASRRPQLATIEVPELAVAGADTEALVSLGLERVTSLVSALSDDQRDVILLRMIGDLSLQQVATALDKPVTAVKALQRRGLRRLQSVVLAEVVTP